MGSNQAIITRDSIRPNHLIRLHWNCIFVIGFVGRFLKQSCLSRPWNSDRFTVSEETKSNSSFWDMSGMKIKHLKSGIKPIKVSSNISR